MSNGGHLDAGLPEELVLNGSFQHAFDKDGIAFDAGTGTFNIHYTGKRSVKVTGEGVAVFWTKKALVRNGFNISLAEENDLIVSVSGDGSESIWTVRQNNELTTYTSLRGFLSAL